MNNFNLVNPWRINVLVGKLTTILLTYLHLDSSNDLQNGDGLVELDVDLSRVLDPRLPVTLHRGPAKESDAHGGSLTQPVRLR